MRRIIKQATGWFILANTMPLLAGAVAYFNKQEFWLVFAKTWGGEIAVMILVFTLFYSLHLILSDE